MRTVDAPLLRRLQVRVGYFPNSRVDTAWRTQRRLERIVPDRDVPALFSGRRVSMPGVMTVGNTPTGKEREKKENHSILGRPRVNARAGWVISFRTSAKSGVLVPSSGQDLGARQSTGGSAEQGDSGRKTRRPAQFGTTVVECHGASVRRVRDVAAANRRAAAFQRIVGRHVRNDARTVLP